MPKMEQPKPHSFRQRFLGMAIRENGILVTFDAAIAWVEGRGDR